MSQYRHSRTTVCPRMSQYRHSRESGNLQVPDNIDIMDYGFHQNDALRAFSDRLFRGNDGAGVLLDNLSRRTSQSYLENRVSQWKALKAAISEKWIAIRENQNKVW